MLGMCYESGYGVEENMCRAADLYAKAADSGHPDAIFSLAMFHRDGLGGNFTPKQYLLNLASSVTVTVLNL